VMSLVFVSASIDMQLSLERGKAVSAYAPVA